MCLCKFEKYFWRKTIVSWSFIWNMFKANNLSIEHPYNCLHVFLSPFARRPGQRLPASDLHWWACGYTSPLPVGELVESLTLSRDVWTCVSGGFRRIRLVVVFGWSVFVRLRYCVFMLDPSNHAPLHWQRMLLWSAGLMGPYHIDFSTICDCKFCLALAREGWSLRRALGSLQCL